MFEHTVPFQNMHNPPQYSPAICRTGCKCKKGYVLDSHTKKCIKPVECPCHHGGKSYGEGETIQEDCNTWCVKLLINVDTSLSPYFLFCCLYFRTV
jgi:hypothetical protein